MALKAYKVFCTDDDHGAAIVFAESPKGQKYGNSDRCDCEFVDRRVSRAPKFDKYAPGPVTIQQHLDEGWVWSCGCCEDQIFGDEANRYAIAGDWIFCSRECVEKRLTKLEAEITPQHHRSMHEYLAAMRKAMKFYAIKAI